MPIKKDNKTQAKSKLPLNRIPGLYARPNINRIPGLYKHNYIKKKTELLFI